MTDNAQTPNPGAAVHDAASPGGGQRGGLKRAADRIAIAAIGSAHRTWRRLKRTGAVRRYMYSLENSDEFSKIISHEFMVADRTRVDPYKAAIDRQVRPDDIVVDLGTGTGILAIMAAMRGANRVHAIDQTGVIELARHLAHSNGVHNIQFHRTHSGEFDPGEKVSLILHEQIGDFLIDEDMIANVCELRDRVLAPGGRILPARFEAFLEPVSLNKGCGTPLLWEQKIHGIDYSSTRDWLAAHPQFETGGARTIYPGQLRQFLADPAPAYTLDLEEVAPDYAPGHIRMEKEIRREDEFGGFAHYFRIDLGDDIGIDNNPFETERLLMSPHWPANLFPADRVAVKPGDMVDIEWTVDVPTKPLDWKLEWRIRRNGDTIFASPAFPA